MDSLDFTDPVVNPDNLLYRLKIVIENLQTIFTFDDTSKIQLAVKQAEERLREINYLIKHYKLDRVN